jgi:hypothetical protein
MMPAYSRMVARVKEMQRCKSRLSRRQTLEAFGDGGMAAIIMHRSPKSLRIQEFACFVPEGAHESNHKIRTGSSRDRVLCA